MCLIHAEIVMKRDTRRMT